MSLHADANLVHGECNLGSKSLLILSLETLIIDQKRKYLLQVFVVSGEYPLVLRSNSVEEYHISREDLNALESMTVRN